MFLIKKGRKRKQESGTELEGSLSECTGGLSTPKFLTRTEVDWGQICLSGLGSECFYWLADKLERRLVKTIINLG